MIGMKLLKQEDFNNGRHDEAVSYTHLDVYKRQLGDRNAQLPGKGFGTAHTRLIAEMRHLMGIRIDEPGELVLPGELPHPAVGIGAAVPVSVGVDLHRNCLLYTSRGV